MADPITFFIMVEIFSLFWDLFFYPIYNIRNDFFIGILFYSLILYWLAETLFTFLFSFKK